MAKKQGKKSKEEINNKKEKTRGSEGEVGNWEEKGKMDRGTLPARAIAVRAAIYEAIIRVNITYMYIYIYKCNELVCKAWGIFSFPLALSYLNSFLIPSPSLFHAFSVFRFFSLTFLSSYGGCFTPPQKMRDHQSKGAKKRAKSTQSNFYYFYTEQNRGEKLNEKHSSIEDIKKKCCVQKMRPRVRKWMKMQ